MYSSMNNCRKRTNNVIGVWLEMAKTLLYDSGNDLVLFQKSTNSYSYCFVQNKYSTIRVIMLLYILGISSKSIYLSMVLFNAIKLSIFTSHRDINWNFWGKFFSLSFHVISKKKERIREIWSFENTLMCNNDKLIMWLLYKHVEVYIFCNFIFY